MSCGTDFKMASCIGVHEALANSDASNESDASSEDWCSRKDSASAGSTTSTQASTTASDDQEYDGSTFHVPIGSLVPKEVLHVDFTQCSTMPVMAPFDYVNSLPSKGVREQAIMALNEWVDTTPESLQIVTELVSDIHNLSLMLDDVEDNSPLRRSAPSTHNIFGMPQTVNSASYMIIDVIDRASRLENPALLAVVIDEMKSLVAGQGLDLFWTFAMCPPTVQEYLEMVDGKTGALFRMISKMLVACQRVPQQIPDLSKLMTLLGRYFQIRDDYMNLVSHQYTDSKGTCEDLDEGKYSYIMIHALQNAQPKTKNILQALLLQRKSAGCAGPGQKELFLKVFWETGSLGHTAALLGSLRLAIIAEVELVEQATGRTNNRLRMILEALKV
ncbi:geranylgeranyl pyrophosphate synthetase [Colletotrichum eremochloae]|nr:geranylgeranyl pyrophosphate synthetase [Colletotrichum eremochloae]